MDSILTSIKKLLGITESYEHFDPDIVMHINSALMILTQLGVGPPEGFVIEDDSSLWTDFLADTTNLEAVRSYVFMKVKLMFDPPTSGIVTEAYNRMVTELEWRLNVNAESNNSWVKEESQNGI